MKNVFEVLRITRGNYLKVAEQLSDEQLRKIPAGFNNNILWHMGHAISSTQKLTYGLSDQPVKIPETFSAFFSKGTSPKEWTSSPDISQMKELLQSTAVQLKEDYERGIFRNYKEYQTSYGYLITSIEDAILFANVHEGLHLGNILSMRKLV